MKKFAYLLMGSGVDPAAQQACFETPGGESCMFTVRNFEEAKERALWCAQQGFGAIEVCGAFGEEKARELARLTGDKLVVGYVQSLPEHEDLAKAFFGN